MTDSPLLMPCDGPCGGASTLLRVRIDGNELCLECWTRMGRPYPRRPPTVGEVHAAETATRERMNDRGGADRHMVRSGKS